MKESSIEKRLKKEADNRIVERQTNHLPEDVLKMHKESQRILKRIRDGEEG